MSLPAAIVPAQAWDDYPTLRIVREGELLDVVRVEACACGERIRQLEGDDVASVVRRHNETMAHRAWRAEVER